MFKRILYAILILVVATAIITYSCYHYIGSYAKPYLYSDVTKIPYRKVALVLGTSKNIGEYENLFFTYRMNTAAQLYKQKKTSYFLVSGDNHVKSYNEPADMQEELIKRGIPADHIILDYAGFRTLDAVARCKTIFGQDSIVIVSQRFHNERALFLCRHFGINAVAINAQDLPTSASVRTSIREYFARVKAFLDCYILHTQPHFYGKPITIPD